MLGSFERVYFAHWLMLRVVLNAALGAHTCVAAEFGATCDAEVWRLTVNPYPYPYP